VTGTDSFFSGLVICFAKTDKIPIRAWSREQIVNKLAEKGFPAVPPPLSAGHTESATNSDL
jgi:hypothetical protein